jgi:hypothetical protein
MVSFLETASRKAYELYTELFRGVTLTIAAKLERLINAQASREEATKADDEVDEAEMSFCQCDGEEGPYESENEEADVERSCSGAKSKGTPRKVDPTLTLRDAQKRLDVWMRQLPVVGFNSAKYDIPLIKPYLIKCLMNQPADDNEKKTQDISVIKKGNSYVKVSTRNLLFLDACSYAAPGYSYSKFLAAYGVTEAKSFFPYEYVTGLEVLEEERLPPYDAFYSTLKAANTLEEGKGVERGARNYADLQKVWVREDMKTVRDLLVYYNNCDVGPFLKALEKQVAVYNAMGMDMLKDAVTLPGLSLRYSMKDLGGVFYTLGGPTADMAALIRKQMTGGPALVFHRFAEAGTTKIRPERYGEAGAKSCKAVIGYDCNSLYPFSMAQEMPVGPCTVRVGPDFVSMRQDCGPRHSTVALEWLEFVAHRTGHRVQHAANGPEVKLGEATVDGFVHETQTAYQFHGCYHHGHECPKGIRSDGMRQERRRKTEESDEYIRRECGVDLVVQWGCQWEEEKQGGNLAAVEFIRQRTALRAPGRSSLPARMVNGHQETILKAVENGKLFGMVQVDIHVPEELRTRFEDMPPIFKTTSVGRDDIGDYMKRHCEQMGIMKKPSRMLISSYWAEGMLLITPLLRWYLQKGLVVTRIHLVMEWQSQRRFEEMTYNVAQLRRDADGDPKKAVTGNSAKLLANSAYGKLCEDRARFRRVKYVRGSELRRHVKSPLFCDMQPVSDVHTSSESRLEYGRNIRDRQDDVQALEDEVIEEVEDEENALYEVTSVPRRTHIDMPVQIAYFVYQYAKLRMLEFTYDVLDKYLCPTKWRPMYMDTDSMYLACAENALSEALRPETKSEFFRDVFHKWFPTESCELHKEDFVRHMTSSPPLQQQWNGSRVCCEARHKYDLRTPGLFKEEWRGSGMVALCAKTYFCKGDTDKLSCKGLQKGRNNVTYEQYKRVLCTRCPVHVRTAA